MNREDAGFVHQRHGSRQQLLIAHIILTFIDQCLQERIIRSVAIGVAGLVDPSGNAGPEFRCRGNGKGEYENLVDCEGRVATAQQESQHKVGDGVGLAGAGTGLDQLIIRKGQAGGTEFNGHRLPPAAVARPGGHG